MKFTSPANIALASLALSSPSLLASPNGMFANAAPTPDASLLSPNPNSGYLGGSPQLQSSESPLLQGSDTFGAPPTAKIAGRRRSLRRSGSVKSRTEGSPEHHNGGTGLGLGLGLGLLGFGHESEPNVFVRPRATLPTNTLAPDLILASVIQPIPTSTSLPYLDGVPAPVPSLVVPEIRLPSPDLPAHADVQPHGSDAPEDGSPGKVGPNLGIPQLPNLGKTVVPVLNLARNLLNTAQPSSLNGPIQSLESEVDGLVSSLPIPLPLPKLSDLPLPKLDMPISVPNGLPQLPPAAALVGGLPIRRALGQGIIQTGTDGLDGDVDGTDLPGVGLIAPPNSPLAGTPLPTWGEAPLSVLPSVTMSGMPALPTGGLPLGTLPIPLPVPIPSMSVPNVPIPGQVNAQSLGGLGLPLDGLSGLPALPLDGLPIPSTLPGPVPAVPFDGLPIPGLPVALPSNALPVSLPVPVTSGLPAITPIIPGSVLGLIPGVPALPVDGLIIPSLSPPGPPVPLPTGVLAGIPLPSIPLSTPTGLPIVPVPSVGDPSGTVGGSPGAVGAGDGVSGVASGVTGAVSGSALSHPGVPSLPILGSTPDRLGATPFPFAVLPGTATIKSATVDSPIVPLPGSAQSSSDQFANEAPKNDGDESDGSDGEDEMDGDTVNGSGMGAMGRPLAVQSGEKEKGRKEKDRQGESRVGPESNTPPAATTSNTPSSTTDIAPRETGTREPMTSGGKSDPEATSTNYKPSAPARTTAHTEKSRTGSEVASATPGVMGKMSAWGKKRMLKVRATVASEPASTTALPMSEPTEASRFMSLVRSVIRPDNQLASTGSRRIFRREGRRAQWLDLGSEVRDNSR